MATLSGPVLSAAVLLLIAGAPKTWSPQDAVGALRSVGRPVPTWWVRCFGAVEAGIGAWALLAGGRTPAALIAASYLGFTGFVVLAMRRGGAVSTCGCVGRPDTPPTVAHATITGAFALLAAVAAGTGADGLAALGGGSAVTTVTFLTITAVCTWLAWLGLAELPRLHTARRLTSAAT